MSDSVQFAAESNPGAGGSKVPQQDVVQAGPVTTAGGLKLSLAIVVDGDGDRAAPAAKEALQAFVGSITSSRLTDLSRVLAQALKAASEVAAQATGVGEPIRIHLAAATVHNGRLYWTSRGQARVYLVQNSRHAELLTTEAAAEAAMPPVISPAAERQSRVVQRGDSVVVCSDGLTEPRGPGQPAYVTDDEIAHWVKDQPALKAARYLLSEALGRNAPDNVSAAVLQLPPSPLAALLTLPVLVVGLVLLIGVLGGGGLLYALSARPTPTPIATPTQVNDVGVVTVGTGSGAVHTESSANSPTVEPIFQFVGRGAVLSTLNEGANLGLWPSAAGPQDPATIYLDANTTVQLDQLWPEGSGPGGETHLILSQGNILVDGTSSQRAFIISTALGAAVQNGAGSSRILAVELLANGQLNLYCLAGQCSFRPASPGANPVEVPAGSLLPVTSTGAGAARALSDQEKNRWRKFCAATCAVTDPATPTSALTVTPGPTAPSAATAPAGPTAKPTLPADVDSLATVNGLNVKTVVLDPLPNQNTANSTYLPNGTAVYILKTKHQIIGNTEWAQVRLLDGSKTGWMPWLSLKPHYY